MKKFDSVAEKIVRDYLGVSPKERLFIVTDKSSGFPFHLSMACHEFASEHGIESRTVKQNQISYGPPDRRTVNLLKGLKKNDCLLVCLDGQL